MGVTAGIAALAGATLGRSGLIALAAAGLGLGLLSLSAAAENGIQLPLGWRWILLASAVPIGGTETVVTSLTDRGAGRCDDYRRRRRPRQGHRGPVVVAYWVRAGTPPGPIL